MCQGFGHFLGFLHHLVLVELATSSIKVEKLHCYRETSISVGIFIHGRCEWVSSSRIALHIHPKLVNQQK